MGFVRGSDDRKGSDFIGTTIFGMTGRGSIRHNNRSFSVANIDRSRTEQNVTFCNEDLKQVYHEIFDEAWPPIMPKRNRLGKRAPTTMSITARASKKSCSMRKSFVLATWRTVLRPPRGDRAAAVLKEFAESFQEHKPHLRVFDMELHMDEVTPMFM